MNQFNPCYTTTATRTHQQTWKTKDVDKAHQMKVHVIVQSRNLSSKCVASYIRPDYTTFVGILAEYMFLKRLNETYKIGIIEKSI